jgi:ABC-type multidrug transport system ATPase subunit
LFLDEPTTGLDIQSRSDLWDMIRELVADGTTVLLTTQYLEEADRLASQIAVVDRGHVIAMDTPSALKARLGSTVIEVGLADEAAAQRAEKLLARMNGHVPEREGSLVRLTSEEAPKLLMEVLRTLDGKRLRPVTVAVREPSLDDVFLSLTGRHAEEETAAPAPRKGAIA